MTTQAAVRVLVAAIALAVTLAIAASLTGGAEEFAGNGLNIRDLAGDTSVFFSGKASGSGR